ncbi:hypothetical protein OROHE_015007 [Orobanche hederae]
MDSDPCHKAVTTVNHRSGGDPTSSGATATRDLRRNPMATSRGGDSGQNWEFDD